MSPPTWTTDEPSDSYLCSQLQKLSKIAALSKMAWHGLDRGPSLPTMRIWAPGGSRGGAWVGGVLREFLSRAGMRSFFDSLWLLGCPC